MAHQYRTEVIGSLLRPEYLKGARKRWDGGEITAHEFKETEDRAVDEMIALQEIFVCQQWSFSPQGSTGEIEDYQVDLDNVRALELELKPDLTPGKAVATLAKWRMV